MVLRSCLAVGFGEKKDSGFLEAVLTRGFQEGALATPFGCTLMVSQTTMHAEVPSGNLTN